MATVMGPVNGAPINVNPNGGNVYWSWSADDNLSVAFKLFLKQSATGETTRIAAGVKPCAVHVDFGIDGLSGDTLSWRILCLPLNSGTFPVYVQLFQGTEATGYHPISDVFQYDVKVGPPASRTVSDSIVFVEGAGS